MHWDNDQRSVNFQIRNILNKEFKYHVQRPICYRSVTLFQTFDQRCQNDLWILSLRWVEPFGLESLWVLLWVSSEVHTHNMFKGKQMTGKENLHATLIMKRHINLVQNCMMNSLQFFFQEISNVPLPSVRNSARP